MIRTLLTVLSLLMASEAVAQTRPVARDEVQVQDLAVIRPQERPEVRPALQHGAQTLPLNRAEEGLFARNPNALMMSLHPKVRPAAIEQVAMDARAARLRGQICGDPDLQGDTLGDVAGRGACGVENAVRVRSVAGIRFSSNPTIDCATAIALKTWIERGAIPAVGSEGGGIASIRTMGDYSCRNRNNGAGGKLSEHAKGRAIDIGAIVLKSGQEISVLRGWGTKADGAQLRQMWQAACGPFGTVLGPAANSFHRDHFHFDTARYRSGSYCR